MEQNILSSAVADALSSLKPREDDKELEGVRNLLMNALGSVEAIREYLELSRFEVGRKKWSPRFRKI